MPSKMYVKWGGNISGRPKYHTFTARQSSPGMATLYPVQVILRLFAEPIPDPSGDLPLGRRPAPPISTSSSSRTTVAALVPWAMMKQASMTPRQQRGSANASTCHTTCIDASGNVKLFPLLRGTLAFMFRHLLTGPSLRRQLQMLTALWQLQPKQPFTSRQARKHASQPARK